VSKIVKYGFELGYIRTFKKADNKFIGQWLKGKIITLGPTFIKIGQLISTRKDIFGKEFTDELKDLQDNVNPFPIEDVMIELGDLKKYFEYIDPQPIASASIGQIHKATLKDGQEVVIKARRPNITSTIKDDFELILSLLNIGEKVVKSRRIQEINILFREYYNILLDEVDFMKETQYMKTFSKMFASTPWIKIPKVYDNYSNSNIITMEYASSIKIDDINTITKLGFNRQKIADKLIETYISQIIDFGVINLDPHPGNIGINEKGKLVFYDFGMIMTLDAGFRENFDALLYAIYDKDIDKISKIAIENTFIVLEDADDKPFKEFLGIFLNYIETLDVDNLKIEFIDSFNKENKELNFVLSSKFVMLLRGITILEGVCKELDPSFKYSRNLNKYIDRFIFNIESIEKKVDKDLSLMNSSNNKISSIKTDTDVLKAKIENLQSTIMKMENNQDSKKNLVLNYLSIIVLILEVLYFK
jgi:predicted unusual protein kinase regulating ubiquinone biosynthesis (AarF/ABC1/UbiB family)